MKFIVTRTLGSSKFTIEFDNERDLKEAIIKATPFMEMSGKCGKCGSEDVYLKGRPVKGGFQYVELYCRKCHCKQGFGEYKDVKGALFLKEWTDAYTGSEKTVEED
jgi:hypothetical protein